MELLAPAGNFEKLETAIHFGADAVYLAGRQFSLREYAGNFDDQELVQAVHTAHEAGVRVYVACNIYARHQDLDRIATFLGFLKPLGVDGLIVADPGVVMVARDVVPELPLHLSTQANTTNFQAIRMWQTMGVRRINVARELSLAEIADLNEHCPDIELEAFVHGAMCVAYSGRCLLSAYLSNRSSNRGQCNHPCRWPFTISQSRRPHQKWPMAEDQHGTYVFNSLDLCMVNHLPRMLAGGVTVLKIEGRMKGLHYLATTIKAYRQALDAYLADPDDPPAPDPHWQEELDLVGWRGYGTGFYLDDPSQTAPNYEPTPPKSPMMFVANVLWAPEPGKLVVRVRNKFEVGDSIQVLQPTGRPVTDTILAIDDQGATTMARPGRIVTLSCRGSYHPRDLIRKAVTP